MYVKTCLGIFAGSLENVCSCSFSTFILEKLKITQGSVLENVDNFIQHRAEFYFPLVNSISCYHNPPSEETQNSTNFDKVEIIWYRY